MNSPHRASCSGRCGGPLSRISAHFIPVILMLGIALIESAAPHAGLAATPEPPQKPMNYVVDLAGIISNDVGKKLNAYLKELEQKTTAQVVVLTVNSLDGEDIAAFSLRMAERWKLGQKGKDNGALIAIAVKDRKYRFEIGYGLESVLPDSMVGSIGREFLVPYFKKGDYGTGIYNATLAVAKEIALGAGVEITGMPSAQKAATKKTDDFPLVTAVLIGLFIAAFFFSSISGFRRRIGQGGPIIWQGPTGGGWSSGGFGGGGGGGGGFGGGGGGGFGGGGSSGSW